jgi:hypothetical protein
MYASAHVSKRNSIYAKTKKDDADTPARCVASGIPSQTNLYAWGRRWQTRLRNQFLKDAICVRELEKDFRGFKAINKLSLRVKRVLRRGVWIGKQQIAAREPVIRCKQRLNLND